MQEYLTLIRVLNAVIKNGRSMDRCFQEQDSPLGKQLCYGVIRHYYSLNKLLAALTRKTIADKHLDIQLLILAGIYSIDHLNRPAHASVNKVVNTTLKLKKSWAKGLVNGILRNYIRQAETLNAALDDDESTTDHPAWLVDRLKVAYPTDWQAITHANNQQAPMTLRINLAKVKLADYREQLDDIGLASHPGLNSPSALYLEQATNVTLLPGFDDGMLSVQDEASQLAAGLLDLQSGHRVLDACAAPGGKTCHMLESMPGIQLTALDISQSRLDFVQDNLDRLGLEAQLVCADLEHFETDVKFDRILLDAPCSATGIIRRHPDIKLLRRNSDIAKLAAGQTRLLNKAWSLLEDGGLLVYSTCSLLPDENEAIVAEFVKQETSAKVLGFPNQDETVDWGHATDHGRQLLPNESGGDGFFYARLQKLTNI